MVCVLPRVTVWPLLSLPSGEKSLFFNLAAGHRGEMVEAMMLGQAPRGVQGRLQPWGLRREDKREPGCDPEPLVNLAALQDLSFPTRD